MNELVTFKNLFMNKVHTYTTFAQKRSYTYLIVFILVDISDCHLDLPDFLDLPSGLTNLAALLTLLDLLNPLSLLDPPPS